MAVYSFGKDKKGNLKVSRPTPIVEENLLFKIELFLRLKGFKKIPNAMAKWDERKLGKD